MMILRVSLQRSVLLCELYSTHFYLFIHFAQLAELASRREPDKIRLGPRPGGRVLSVVSAPKKNELVDLDESSDDELVVGPLETS